MTQRPLGRGSGIIAAKSYFMLVKWLVPVNRNMIAKAPRPAALQEESRLTPSKPTPRRMMNEATRTNKDTMCLLSARAGWSALRLCCGPLRVAYFSVRHSPHRMPTDQYRRPGYRLLLLSILSPPPSLIWPEPTFRSGFQSAPRRGPKPPALLPHY